MGCMLRKSSLKNLQTCQQQSASHSAQSDPVGVTLQHDLSRYPTEAEHSGLCIYTEIAGKRNVPVGMRASTS